MVRAFCQLSFLLLTSCALLEKIPKAGASLDLQVLASHRQIVGIPPQGSIDYKSFRNILVELDPQERNSSPLPENRQITFSADGVQPQNIVLRSGDRLILVNAAHRPLHLRSMGKLEIDLKINHSEVISLLTPIEFDEDTIFDESQSRIIKVTHSTATRAQYVRSHQRTVFQNLTEGLWRLQIHHPRIPSLNVPIELKNGKTIVLNQPFEVGRLPLIR